MNERRVFIQDGHPTVFGRDLQVGDDLEFLGRYYRVTDFKDYSHPTITGGEVWRIAYSRKIKTQSDQQAWGMTIDPGGTFRIAQPVERSQ